jgi:hypothetical protein
MTKRPWLILALAAAVAPTAVAQSDSGERVRVLAVVDSALAAITREDMKSLANLMLDEALTFPITERDGVGRYRVRPREVTITPAGEDYVERGFDPEVRVTGAMAVVWLPYDFYRNSQWSHCGVDAFTLVRVEAGWRIATLAYTVEQPPACRPHPDGPPRP